MAAFWRNIILAGAAAVLACAAPACHAAQEDAAEIEQLDFANGLFQRGMYEMAITEYDKLITVYPGSKFAGDAYFGEAESLMFLESYADAVTAYKEYLELFHDGEHRNIVNLRLGQCLLYLKEPSAALEYFDKVNETGMEAHLRQLLNLSRARALIAVGEKDGALTYLEKSASIAEKSDYSAYSLIDEGDVYLDRKDYQAANASYERALNAADTAKARMFALHKLGEGTFTGGDYQRAAETFKKILDENPDAEGAPNALTNLLSALFNMREYGKITGLFDKYEHTVMEKNKSFQAYYIAAQSYAETGQYDRALEILTSLIPAGWVTKEEREKAFLKKAEIMIRAKKNEEILNYLDTTLKDSGLINISDMDFIRAEAYYGMGNYKEALDLYNSVVSRDDGSPFSDNARYSLAFCFKAIGDDKGAIDTFLKYFYDGKDHLKRSDALYNAILMESGAGMREAAIEHCLLYLDTFSSGELRDKVLFRLGLIYSDMKRYGDAVDVFKKFIHEYPENANLTKAYFELAYNLQSSGIRDEALKYYAKISRESGSELYYSALKNTALIYLGDDRTGNAARVFKRIIEEFGDNDLGIDVYLWLSRYYIENRAYSEALEILRKSENKEYAVSKKGEVYYFRGEAYRGLDDYRKALGAYESVIDSAEYDASLRSAAFIGKGICMERSGDYQKARDAFEAAIKENPDDNTAVMRARFEIANVEKALGNLDEAAKLYMLIAILYNNELYCPEALYSAGQIFEGSGKKEDAVKAYDEIVTRYPKSPLAVKAKERLEVL